VFLKYIFGGQRTNFGVISYTPVAAFLDPSSLIFVFAEYFSCFNFLWWNWISVLDSTQARVSASEAFAKCSWSGCLIRKNRMYTVVFSN